jgi:hypothetical protein
MNYIIEHDFRTSDIPYYVGKIDDTTFQEIYDPYFAWTFPTKEDAQKWINTYSSMSDVSKIVDQKSAIEKYQNWISSGAIRRTLKLINTKKSRPYNNESLDEVIDWWIYQTHNDSEIKYEHYETWPELNEMSKHLFNIEAYHTLDYSELYITFQIYTKKSGNFKEFEAELNRVMNKVTYKTDDGFLIFPIFDHYLSEHGNSVCLEIHPETKQARISGRYYSDEDYDSLEDAFKYMKKVRYYE